MNICTLCIFSLVHNGVGFALNIFGILWLLLSFQCNLHSIKEKPSTRYSWTSYLSCKYVISKLFATSIFAIIILAPFYETANIYLLKVQKLLIIIFLFIVMPQHWINQDPNLKFYVSVYHCQPPPVLPWQLPRHFDKKSVKLICVGDEYKE